MSQSVVDLLKAIEGQQYCAHHQRRALGLRQGLRQAVYEEYPIRQVGERVMICKVIDLGSALPY